jgi:hypothetical protein
MATKLKVRTGKINRHEKITQILLNGKPTSPEDILLCLKGTDQEKVGYRLATNIYNIRRDGGVIKVFKAGRNVTAYQLKNWNEFNAEGRYIGRPTTVTPVTERETVVTEIVTEELETA